MPEPALTGRGNAPNDAARGVSTGAPGALAEPPDELPATPERLAAFLAEGPLLPFDYVYLSGQRQRLIPVVQAQLVAREPALMRSDRTALGVDPNAPLVRCFTMHGDARVNVSVRRRYEAQVCEGVPVQYFELPSTIQALTRLYRRMQFIRAHVKARTERGQAWLRQYGAVLDATLAALQTAGASERIAWLEALGAWVLPCAWRTADPERYRPESPTEAQRFFAGLLGDFTLLSRVSEPTFCALAWLREVYFAKVRQRDATLGLEASMGQFSPVGLVWATIVAAFGLLMLRGDGGGTLLLGVLAIVIGGVQLLRNLVYWLLFTSGSKRLQRVVPRKYQKFESLDVWYLR